MVLKTVLYCYIQYFRWLVDVRHEWAITQVTIQHKKKSVSWFSNILFKFHTHHPILYLLRR